MTFNNFYYDEKGGYDLAREFTATFSNWSLNALLAAGTFTIEFPDGTLVNDLIKNRSYFKGSVTDPAIKGHVAVVKALGPGVAAKGETPNVRELARLHQESRRNNPYAQSAWSRWGTWALVTIAAVAVVGVVVRQIARRNQGRTVA